MPRRINAFGYAARTVLLASVGSSPGSTVNSPLSSSVTTWNIRVPIFGIAFSRSSIIALNTAIVPIRVSTLLEREGKRWMRRVLRTRGMERMSELTFRQSRCVFPILRGSDRETKFLSIIRNEVINKNRHPFRLEIFEILFHSLPSNVPRIELPSRKECGVEGKGFRSEATSGRRPNAAKSSAI